MDLPALTKDDLKELAAIAGRAAGESYAEAVLTLEQDLQAATPPTPLDAAATAVLALIPDWAQEAATTPRAKESMQAKLLAAAIEYRQQVKAAKEEAESG